MSEGLLSFLLGRKQPEPQPMTRRERIAAFAKNGPADMRLPTAAEVKRQRNLKAIQNAQRSQRINDLNQVLNTPTGAHAMSAAKKIRARQLRDQEILNNL